RDRAGAVADALVSAVRAVEPAVALVPSDHHGKEVAARAAVLLGSACTADASDLRVQDGALTASKTVLSGSWATTLRVGGTGTTPVVAVRTSEVEVPGPGAPLAVEALDVVLSPESLAVRVVSREPAPTTSGPDLVGARTVVVAGRGVDGDIDLVRSLADPLGAAVGATRVACDEGWVERSAQVGQTGVSIAPRLYIGLGVSGAVHHTSGIQGAGTIVAVCDDAEAPILQMADFGVVGDVRTVVPQLVEELGRLRG
uniref:electron transfer flavoprotein subunit alpha/FixB family protein n=1 Tax=Actinomyces sp. 217892 TaxID=2927827 RepID=UPI00202EC8B4